MCGGLFIEMLIVYRTEMIRTQNKNSCYYDYDNTGKPVLIISSNSLYQLYHTFGGKYRKYRVNFKGENQYPKI